MFKRLLEDNFPERSFFLFGPRQVGKSTLIRKQQPTLTIDLLDPEQQLAYNKNPNLLKAQIEDVPPKAWVFIDEVQRVPKLLDVIHGIMEEKKGVRFILCGSSARKLRHGASNLLGGRALYRTLHPLSFLELRDSFRLDWVLSYGSLPPIYSLLMEKEVRSAQDMLRTYGITYLREEVKAEALVRNLQGFQNFLDIAVSNYTQQVNFSTVSRDCQSALSTVREFYSILEDTLIGFFLPPYLRSERKRMSHQPKFYFFDNGVTRALSGTLRDTPTALEKGRLFEQWVVQEIMRINEYFQKDWKLFFWRTGHGAEVDLLILRGARILYAIECKFTPQPSSSDLSGLRSFHELYPTVPCILVAPTRLRFRISFARVIPPQILFEEIP
jgi:predicted AAA+ superfamily ATPase